MAYKFDMTQIHVGTGGFSNEDWVGLFYPSELKKTQWLEFYSEHFDAVEINSTFYAVPAQKSMTSMLERSGGRVTFCAKLHGSFTHDLTADADAAARFRFTMQPIQDAGKLGALLAQFPFRFKNVPESRAYLTTLAGWFQGVPVAVEFRHQSWDKEPVYQFLADLGLLPVSVDLPALEGLPKPVLRKGDLAYLRFHGRNRANWFEGKDASERHDYLYAPAELEPWVTALKASRVGQAFVFFENTTRGQGLQNAREFKALWGAQP
ncbi:MAG: DUF72 domain-containing protein [Pleurocapsa sp. SU_196_0]|nr:DUF72 domain-containing protein [Pleurocapsa sp. SU_196_0]